MLISFNFRFFRSRFAFAISIFRLCFYSSKGMLGWEGITLAIYLTPAVVLSTILGQRAQLGLSEQAFRRIVVTLLAVAGTMCFI